MVSWFDIEALLWEDGHYFRRAELSPFFLSILRNTQFLLMDRFIYFMGFVSFVVADNLAFDELFLNLVDEAHEVVDFFTWIVLFLQHL